MPPHLFSCLKKRIARPSVFFRILIVLFLFSQHLLRLKKTSSASKTSTYKFSSLSLAAAACPQQQVQFFFGVGDKFCREHILHMSAQEKVPVCTIGDLKKAIGRDFCCKAKSNKFFFQAWFEPWHLWKQCHANFYIVGGNQNQSSRVLKKFTCIVILNIDGMQMGNQYPTTCADTRGAKFFCAAFDARINKKKTGEFWWH